MSRNRGRTFRSIAATIAIAVGMAACGGDDDSGASDAAPEDTSDAAPEDTSDAAPEDTSDAAPDVDAVKIVLIAPLTGPFAREGELMSAGASLGVDEVNDQGGIASLGGANLELEVVDAGASVEEAVSAAQRVVSDDDVSFVLGAFLSSFTLGVSEVTERAGVPLLTLSFADSVTDRGFRYVFQDSPTSSVVVETVLPALEEIAAGADVDLTRWGAIGEDSASSLDFKSAFEGLLDDELVLNETFTAPLADPTGVVQKAIQEDIQINLSSAYVFADALAIVRKFRELGSNVPVIAVGETLINPDILEALGEDGVEGLMGMVASFPGAGAEDVVARFVEESGQPWMTQNAFSSYAEIWIAKEALEAAGSTDREALRDALAGLDITEGPAALLPGGRVRFDEAGRRIDAVGEIVQWQNGEPCVVWPEEMAVCDPLFPTN